MKKWNCSNKRTDGSPRFPLYIDSCSMTNTSHFHTHESCFWVCLAIFPKQFARTYAYKYYKGCQLHWWSEVLSNFSENALSHKLRVQEYNLEFSLCYSLLWTVELFYFWIIKAKLKNITAFSVTGKIFESSVRCAMNIISIKQKYPVKKIHHLRNAFQTLKSIYLNAYSSLVKLYTKAFCIWLLLFL